MLATDHMVVNWVARSLRLVLKTINATSFGTFRFLSARREQRAERKAARVLDVVAIEEEDLEEFEAIDVYDEEHQEGQVAGPEIRIGGRRIAKESVALKDELEDELKMNLKLLEANEPCRYGKTQTSQIAASTLQVS